MPTLRIKGLNRSVARGRVYWYHRASRRRVDIDPDTNERFDPEREPARCAALVERYNREFRLPFAAAEPKAATLGDLIDLYKRSPEAAGLAAQTHRTYEIVFQKLRDLGLRDMPLTVVEDTGSPLVIRLRDRVYRESGWWLANYSVAVLRLLFSWAKPYGHMRTNPAMGVKRLKRPKNMRKLNRAWSMEELQAVLDEAAARELWGVRAAIALGLLRLSRADIVQFPWSSFNGTEIDATRNKTGVSLWKPCPTFVLEILQTTPRVYKLGRRRSARTGLPERESLTVVANQFGEPYTGAGLSATFRKLIVSLEAEGRVQPGLTLHGLGHTVGKWLAESGSTTKQIQAFLGHDSPAASEFYLRHANQRELARDAVEKLERNMNKFAKR